jgi:hypothetical protein
MYGGVTLPRSGHFLGMRPIRKIILPNIQVAWMARMLEVHMAMTRNQFLVPKNWFVHLVVHHKPKIVIVTKDQTIMVIHHKPIWPLGAFDCGTNGLCEGGAWGLCRLEDNSRPTNQ